MFRWRTVAPTVTYIPNRSDDLLLMRHYYYPCYGVLMAVNLAVIAVLGWGGRWGGGWAWWRRLKPSERVTSDRGHME